MERSGLGCVVWLRSAQPGSTVERPHRRENEKRFWRAPQASEREGNGHAEFAALRQMYCVFLLMEESEEQSKFTRSLFHRSVPNGMVDVVVMQSSRRSHAGLRRLGLLVTVCVQLWIQGSLTSYAVALREATERHSTLQVNRSHRAPSHSHMHLSLAYPPVWSIPTLPTLLPTRLCPSLPTSVPSCGIVYYQETHDMHVHVHVCMGNTVCAAGGVA